VQSSSSLEDSLQANPSDWRRHAAVAVGLATIAYLVWLVLAHQNEIDRAVLRFSRTQSRWLFAAIGLEIVSQGCGVVVQYRLLRRAGTDMGIAAISRLVLAQNAIGLALPGGAAFASAFSYRQIRRRGTKGVAAAWVVAATNVIGLLALVAFGAFTTTGISWLSVLTAVLLVAALIVLVVLARAPHRLHRPATVLVEVVEKSIRRRPSTQSASVRVEQRLTRLRTVRLYWNDWLILGAFALFAVAADCGVWTCASHAIIVLPPRCHSTQLIARLAQECTAFKSPSSGGIFVAYAAGQAALAVPVLPGGIGLVESFMTASLTATKVRPIPALSAVLLYRLISFWGVLVVGGIAWWALRRQPRGSPSG
jgi:uncharacterized membrane protein YbhN (UPF0104 family)